MKKQDQFKISNITRIINAYYLKENVFVNIGARERERDRERERERERRRKDKKRYCENEKEREGIYQKVGKIGNGRSKKIEQKEGLNGCCLLFLVFIPLDSSSLMRAQPMSMSIT